MVAASVCLKCFCWFCFCFLLWPFLTTALSSYVCHSTSPSLLLMTALMDPSGRALIMFQASKRVMSCRLTPWICNSSSPCCRPLCSAAPPDTYTETNHYLFTTNKFHTFNMYVSLSVSVDFKSSVSSLQFYTVATMTDTSTALVLQRFKNLVFKKIVLQ